MRVLFVGNSFTFGNRMTEIVAGLSQAAARGPGAIETSMVAEGGKTLRYLWEQPKTRSAVEKHAWDAVVLQEHSCQLGIVNEWKLSCGMFAEKCRRARPSTRVLLYMLWRVKDEILEEKAQVYRRIAADIGAEVVPVANAWERAATEGGLNLLASDHWHANYVGSYLIACTFFSTLKGKSPEGLTYRTVWSDDDDRVRELEPDTAAYLQKVAWEEVGKWSTA